MVIHRPGPGAIVAITGLMMFAVSLFALPWASEGGQDVTLSDIGNTLDALDDLDAGVATTGGDEFKTDFLRMYADWIGIFLVASLAVAVVFSTLAVPRSKGGRAVFGFLAGGWLGLIVNLVDQDGTAGPRVTGALVALEVALVHGFALYILFVDPELAPDPAVGIWVGLAGLATVLTGVVIGTRIQRIPA